MRNTGPLNVGLVSSHPIRLEGLTTIFDLPEEEGESALSPVAGTLADLLTRTDINFLSWTFRLQTAASRCLIRSGARVRRFT